MVARCSRKTRTPAILDDEPSWRQQLGKIQALLAIFVPLLASRAEHDLRYCYFMRIVYSAGRHRGVYVKVVRGYSLVRIFEGLALLRSFFFTGFLCPMSGSRSMPKRGILGCNTLSWPSLPIAFRRSNLQWKENLSMPSGSLCRRSKKSARSSE